jgi:hypothetical protein
MADHRDASTVRAAWMVITAIILGFFLAGAWATPAALP